jgi:hypothetical protein
LRIELKALRESEKRGDGAPVRNNRAISPTDIADLAITLLEMCAAGSGEHLICLLRELLNVDRHRKHLSQADGNRRQMFEAALEDATAALARERFTDLKELSVRSLAFRCGVSIATISTWRKCEEYKKKVASLKEEWERRLRDGIEVIRNNHPALSEEEIFDLALGSERHESFMDGEEEFPSEEEMFYLEEIMLAFWREDVEMKKKAASAKERWERKLRVLLERIRDDYPDLSKEEIFYLALDRVSFESLHIPEDIL